MSLNKKVVLIGVFIIAATLVIAYITQQRQAPAETVSPTVGTIAKTVKASGNLQSGGAVNLYANATGIITKLYVQNNEPVVRGQKIADIKSTATEVEIATARANYQTALNNLKASQSGKPALQSQLEAARKAVIDAANAENKLNERLGSSQPNPVTGKTYTQEEIDSIRSAITSARQAFTAAEQKYKDADASIAATQSALALAQLNLNSTKDAALKANADGTILNLAVQEGDLVKAGADGLPIPVSPLAIITDLSQYTIKVPINETRIAEIEIGQDVRIIFDSDKATTYAGLVRTKDTIGTNTNGLIAYNVYITPTSFLPETIKPGMTAEVEIATLQSSNTLVLPQTAVNTQGDQQYVQLYNPQSKTTTQLPVTIGLQYQGQVEITSGLNQDDLVISNPDEN